MQKNINFIKRKQAAATRVISQDIKKVKSKEPKNTILALIL